MKKHGVDFLDVFMESKAYPLSAFILLSKTSQSPLVLLLHDVVSLTLIMLTTCPRGVQFPFYALECFLSLPQRAGQCGSMGS